MITYTNIDIIKYKGVISMDKCLTVFNVGEYIHVFTNFSWYNKELNLSKWNNYKDMNIPCTKNIVLSIIQDKEVSFSK